MGVVLTDIPGITTLLDNVIIGGLNPTDHSKRLCQVLEHHQEAGLKLNQSKCQIGVKSVKFLDFQVDELGIHSTDDKVLAMKNALHKIKKNCKLFWGYIIFMREIVTTNSTIYRTFVQTFGQMQCVEVAQTQEETF